MKTDEGTEQRFLDAQNSKGSMFNSNQHVTVSTRYASNKRPFASRRVLGVCLMSSFAWLFLGGCSQGHPTVRAFRGSRLFHPETRVSHTTGLRPRPPVNRLLHISLLLTYSYTHTNVSVTSITSFRKRHGWGREEPKRLMQMRREGWKGDVRCDNRHMHEGTMHGGG